MYVTSWSRAVAITGASPGAAGWPANPASSSTWVCVCRCATVSSHTEPGQPRPGIKMTGRPVPATQTENAVGSNAGCLGAGAGACATTGAGGGGGDDPHATSTAANTASFMATTYLRWRLIPGSW